MVTHFEAVSLAVNLYADCGGCLKATHRNGQTIRLKPGSHPVTGDPVLIILLGTFGNRRHDAGVPLIEFGEWAEVNLLSLCVLRVT